MAHDIDRWTFNRMQPDGYTIGALRAAMCLARAVSIEAGIDHVTDYAFELEMGIPTPDRSCLVTVRHVV